MLYAAPAALDGRSASAGRTACAGHDADDSIDVVVAHDRRLDRPSGRADPAVEALTTAWLQMNLCTPAGPRCEHALVRVAAAAPTDDASVGVLADGCQSTGAPRRRVSPIELRASPRLPRTRTAPRDRRGCCGGRPLRDGAALPGARRRVPTVCLGAGARDRSGRPRVRSNATWTVRRAGVASQELDGSGSGDELSPSDRWDDLNQRHRAPPRQVRLTPSCAGWGQVLQPCRLAALLAQVLKARGWITVRPRRAGRYCRIR